MNRVYILVGNIASGKTTWCHERENHPLFNFRINQDEMGSRKNCLWAARRALEHGFDILIDRTNINKKQRSYWINLANEFDAEVHIIEFLTRPEKCVERALARKNHPTIKNMSKERIKSIVNKFQNEYEKVSNEEGFTSYQSIIIDKPIGFWKRIFNF